MPVLRIETLTLTASELGGEDPLPDLRVPSQRKRRGGARPAPPDPGRAYSLAAHVEGCLPYRLQSRYDRSEVERPFRVAVLENEHLRATFLLELGGRLWSLVHKPTGRELLYQPRVLHYANVALRNAWFCGGVEWNVSVRGHAAHTCAPVFAAEVRADDGSPVLRLYEWDRFRGLAWQIDAMMPDGVPALLIRPRIVNANDAETPAYWWSNIAVAEADGHRVVVPAGQALHFDYDRKLARMPVPVHDGVDTSYPTRIQSAHDFFYDIPAGERPWIAGLDADGAGLVHASTGRLRGRKLFVWGMGPGGRRWQEHLGGRGGGYVELQGGLATTQADYLPMPAGADWSWLEAYLLMDADAATVHGDDWAAAWRHVRGRLDRLLPQARLEAMYERTAAQADRPPREILHRGSGWGALEARRRRADGQAHALPPGMAFDDGSLTDEQAPWLALLERGELPRRPPDEAPGAWVTAAPWRRRLAESIQTGRGDHWLAWLHAGVMAWRAGETDAAADAWRRSLAREPSAWACRNLAVLAGGRGDAREAADLYLHAAALKPVLPELQIECGRALIEAERLDEMGRWLAGLPESIRRSGRLGLLAARAALGREELDEAEAILEGLELADVREGERALTDVWFEVQARRLAAAEGAEVDDELRRRVRRTCRPPKHLDYRMS